MLAERAFILIVDDKENMRGLLREILAPQHDVVLAGDGSAARAELESQRFDVVLTDVRMPGMDGFEIVRFVKARWPLTEVVMMTAFASIASAVDAMRHGAYDYIQKPFDPDEVSLVIARALERHDERAASEASAARPAAVNVTYREALAGARDQGSREYLVALLKAFSGNVSRAAERAGLERESLHRLLRRHVLRAETFRDPGGGEDT